MLDDVFHKLKLQKQIKVQSLAQTKFQYNMDLVQWLYDYFQAQTKGEDVFYAGFERRLEAVRRQTNNAELSEELCMEQMLPHLLPNKATFQHHEFHGKAQDQPGGLFGPLLGQESKAEVNR